MRFVSATVAALALASCGVAYQSPGLKEGISDGTNVHVVPMTAASVIEANMAAYSPRTLPAAFSQTAGTGSGLRGAGAAPGPTLDLQNKPKALELRVPPEVAPAPYQIGVGDVVILATPNAAGTVEQLSGLLAAQNSRQGYTVQDDGAVAIPNVGRVRIAGMTLEEAEAELFQRLVQNQIDPTFSLEIAEFNSKKVSIGGAVKNPGIVPITLTPLYLDQALAGAGGTDVPDRDYASVRIYREGTLYQIPLKELFSNRSLAKVQLIDGDSVFVDTAYDLNLAQAYFAEQIALAQYRQDVRISALNELSSEVNLRRAALADARETFAAQLDLGAVKRDYAYLTGEVAAQTRYPLPFGQAATLADALYDKAGGVPTETGNVAEIYVVRGSQDPREYDAVTAYRLDARNAANIILATRFELRPNDVIFVAEQPVTKWARVVRQIAPALIIEGGKAASTVN